MPRSFSRGALKKTITLPEDALEVAQQLAEEQSISVAEVLRQGLALKKFMADARKEGSRVLVEDPRKLITEIIIF